MPPIKKLSDPIRDLEAGRSSTADANAVQQYNWEAIKSPHVEYVPKPQESHQDLVNSHPIPTAKLTLEVHTPAYLFSLILPQHEIEHVRHNLQAGAEMTIVTTSQISLPSTVSQLYEKQMPGAVFTYKDHPMYPQEDMKDMRGVAKNPTFSYEDLEAQVQRARRMAALAGRYRRIIQQLSRTNVLFMRVLTVATIVVGACTLALLTIHSIGEAGVEGHF